MDGDGKTDSDVPAGATHDRGVDADQFAAQVDQGAAGISGVNGGIGLDEILVAVVVEYAAAAECADDPGSDGLTQAEGVADRHDEISDPELLGVAE